MCIRDREKIWLFFTGMVVLRSMSLVQTPPSVSMPRDSGVTSSSRMPSTSQMCIRDRNYAVNRGSDKRMHISVDAEGYRSKREESLVHLAQMCIRDRIRTVPPELVRLRSAREFLNITTERGTPS